MGFALLRAPVHPAHRAREAIVDVPEGVADEAVRLTDHLRDLASDVEFREAVAVSSVSLAHRWDAALGGTEQKVTDLRRAVRALTSYRSRMATRATPFGLMAGVAVARIAPRPQEAGARLGAAHRRVVRPDHGWLTALATDWERRPEVVRHLRIQANNLCVVRGDRLVVATGPGDPADERPDGRVVREVSVRYTAAVRAAVESARAPVPFVDLEERLVEQFPQASRETIVQMLVGLVEREVLLTELHPSAHHADPAGHVLATLAAPDAPEPAELRAIAAQLTEQSVRTATGAGGTGRQSAWKSLLHRMGGLREQEHLVQVDLALDAEVRLPPAVGAEAERAAHLLWRLSDDVPSLQYHRDFLERYGEDRAVPVKELLDPDVGLGVPADYRQPPSRRTPPGQDGRNPERDRHLLHLAQEATVTGAAEVVLTDDHPLVVRLARDTGTPPAGLELFTQLVATSSAALRDGQFRLVVESTVDEAGASFGRFAHLFPDEDRTALAEMAAASRGGGAAADAVRAQVVFRPRSRSGNVTRMPRLLEPHVPVGAFALGEGDLDLDDLAVRADAHRLFVVRLSDGREVVPAVYHLLRPDRVPDVARLLGDIPRSGARPCRPWNWGAGEDLPYTPRVRYGRTVLALARWRPSEAVRDQDTPFDQWVERVHTWRERWRVPERICLTHSDQRLELLLSEPAHLRVLRRELRRRPDAVVREVLDADDTSGWLRGEGGAHRNELVFPLLSRAVTPAQTSAVSVGTRETPPGCAPRTESTLAALPGRQEARRPLRPRVARGEHLPGGEWLYALVHCSPDRHQELLGRHLPRLLHALPKAVDRWFFIRYRDHDDHVRLRLHGTPEALAGTVLPAVHRWATDLRAHGLIQRLSLDTYAPEYERYGGPAALAAAERAFHADSLAVVKTLDLRERAMLEVEPVLLAAAGYVHLLRAWQGTSVTSGSSDGTDGDPSGPEWLLRAYPKDARHKEFQRRRAEAVALIDPYGDWAGLCARPGGEAVLAAWEKRSRAVADYRRALQGPGAREWYSPGRTLSSLLHMHHNRLIGVDREGELASLAIARGVVQAHRGRRTKGRT
ncbi:lantibiotic dehydratase [Streptomyces sp. NPDC048516]|uniref:lantibiotic dehydratase n=1 Tax=Streptomyces sp. NPDC048516 TaxID=3365565 RepID=UPI00371A039D